VATHSKQSVIKGYIVNLYLPPIEESWTIPVKTEYKIDELINVSFAKTLTKLVAADQAIPVPNPRQMAEGIIVYHFGIKFATANNM
jgi:hypothetical protein